MIRLRYTGIFIFASKILTLATGIVFSIYVARTLTRFEMGVWGFIGGVLLVFSFSREMLPFWATRAIARGNPFGRMTVVANLLLSAPFTLAFLLLVGPIAAHVESEPLVFYVSALYIPVYFSISGLNSIITAKYPHKIALYDLILDTVKISVGILLVHLYGLIGVIVAVLMGNLFYIAYASYVSKADLKSIYKPGVLRWWLKGSWFVLFGILFGIAYTSTDSVLLGFFKLTDPLGAYTVALLITSWISVSSVLAYALMPKLVSGLGDEEDIRSSLDLVLMLALPSLAGCLALNKHLIYLFGSKYIIALDALFLLAFARFFDAISNVALNTILGYEKVDIEQDLSFGNLVKSRTFRFYSFRYLAIFLELVSMLYLIPNYGIQGAAIAVLTASLLLMVISIYFGFWGRRVLSLRQVGNYALATLAMVIVVLIIPKWRFVRTLIILGVGAATYFTSLYLIDRDFRGLIKSVFREIVKFLSSR